MQRNKRTATEISDAGQDSFLDVVSNMVGILIILVVVAGLRVKQIPVEALVDHQKVAEASQKYEEKTTEFQAVQWDCVQLSRQLETMQTQFMIREAEQAQLIDYAASLEAQIRLHQETLDAGTRESFGLQRQLAETDARLDQLRQGTDWLQKNRPKAVTLENYPTPKTRMVQENEKEVHFRLSGGRIAHVPMAQMFERLRLEVIKRQDELLTNRGQITGMVGPIDDFRLKYTITRRDLSMQMAYATGQRSVIELEKCEFIPNGPEIGETVPEAFRDGSLFSQRLLATRQNESTITLWVYPDSFGIYQQVKDYLFKRSYLAAARPLNFGIPIAASPDGSRTSRQ